MPTLWNPPPEFRAVLRHYVVGMALVLATTFAAGCTRRAVTASFPFLREHLGVSDSDLSKQMATLERAGYVAVSKAGRGRGATTTYRITRAGRTAYERHRRALTAILGEAGRP